MRTGGLRSLSITTSGVIFVAFLGDVETVNVQKVSIFPGVHYLFHFTSAVFIDGVFFIGLQLPKVGVHFLCESPPGPPTGVLISDGDGYHEILLPLRARPLRLFLW